MEKEKLNKVIVAMAKEISSLRKECDLEWGEYNEENYNVENIINEFLEEAK